jgi:hypothetical protein
MPSAVEWSLLFAASSSTWIHGEAAPALIKLRRPLAPVRAGTAA